MRVDENRKEVYSFIAMIMPFVLFTLFGQLYLHITGSEFINIDIVDIFIQI